ncbi:hypothetical protein MUP59_00175 [Candidatus Bathyarchaeota archaeon]|nr:hypothetical protein [Candidatus Bathyarchaeota archaeon]
MRFYNATFFCDAGEGPKVFVDAEGPSEETGNWPITVHINLTGHRADNPSITIFLRNKSDLLTFKHSVISAISKVVEVIDA